MKQALYSKKYMNYIRKRHYLYRYSDIQAMCIANRCNDIEHFFKGFKELNFDDLKEPRYIDKYRLNRLVW